MDFTGIGSVADLASGLMDRFFPKDASPAEKLAMTQAIEETVSKRDSAKASIIVAELQQGDNFTKRARPMVVYAGLAMIFINHVLFPVIMRIIGVYYVFGQDMVEGIPAGIPKSIQDMLVPISLPTAFWTAWGGIVSTWVLGRSIEKKGVGGNLGKLASLITGK